MRASEIQQQSLSNSMDRFKSVLGTVIANGTKPLQVAFKTATDGGIAFLQLMNDLNGLLPIVTTGILTLVPLLSV